MSLAHRMRTVAAAQAALRERVTARRERAAVRAQQPETEAELSERMDVRSWPAWMQAAWKRFVESQDRS